MYESEDEVLHRPYVRPNHQFQGGPSKAFNDLIERSSLLNSFARYMGYGNYENYEHHGNYQNQYCCDSLYDFDTIVPGFALLAAALFFFYLLNSTVTSGRKRRDVQAGQGKLYFAEFTT